MSVQSDRDRLRQAADHLDADVVAADENGRTWPHWHAAGQWEATAALLRAIAMSNQTRGGYVTTSPAVQAWFAAHALADAILGTDD